MKHSCGHRACPYPDSDKRDLTPAEFQECLRECTTPDCTRKSARMGDFARMPQRNYQSSHQVSFEETKVRYDHRLVASGPTWNEDDGQGDPYYLTLGSAITLRAVNTSEASGVAVLTKGTIKGKYPPDA